MSSDHAALLTALKSLSCGEDGEGGWAGLSLLAGLCKAGRSDLLRLPARGSAAADLDLPAAQVRAVTCALESPSMTPAVSART